MWEHLNQAWVTAVIASGTLFSQVVVAFYMLRKHEQAIDQLRMRSHVHANWIQHLNSYVGQLWHKATGQDLPDPPQMH